MRKLSGFEKEEIMNRTRAMDDTEKTIAVQAFPTRILLEEIDRRTVTTKKMISEASEIVRNMERNMTLEEMRETLKALRQALRLKDGKEAREDEA